MCACVYLGGNVGGEGEEFWVFPHGGFNQQKVAVEAAAEGAELVLCTARERAALYTQMKQAGEVGVRSGDEATKSIMAG